MGRPRPCPWVGCEYHLHLDINPETGTMIFNVGREKEEVPCGHPLRFRPRTVTRRVNTVQAKGKRPGTAGEEAFRRAEKKLFERFKADVENDGHTCLLDMVKDGRSYTLEEVGDFFSLTRERIRQVEVKGLIKLKTLLPGRLLRDLQGMFEEAMSAKYEDPMCGL